MQQLSSSSSAKGRTAHYVTPLNDREPSHPPSILRHTPPSSWVHPTPSHVRGNERNGICSSSRDHTGISRPQLPRRRIVTTDQRPPGLVLDAAGPGMIQPAFSSSSSVSNLSMSSAAPDAYHHASGGRRRARIRTPAQQQQPSKGGVVKRIYSHMTTSARKDDIRHKHNNGDSDGQNAGEDNNQKGQLGSTAEEESNATTAAEWARQQAPQAGFLQKMGTHVPVMKRRFFILQPGTHLYYFLSPTDTTPRGCLDLEGSWVEEEAGTSRFSICWEGGRRVVLEGRSPEVARDWKEALEQERLSYCKAALSKERRKTSGCMSRIQELETAVRNFKLVEQDRDGALEDAARWKEKFEQLDRSCRQLALQLRRQMVARGKENHTGDRLQATDNDTEEKKEEPGCSDNAMNQDGEDSPEEVERAAEEMRRAEGKSLSLLDTDDDHFDDSSIDVMEVPGNHFSALFNSCEQLKESHRLASDEAVSAVEDLTDANEKVVAVEKRMAKAEKHLCKLWEENCALRKTLKQKKREKTVLVREVKNLLEESKAREERTRSSRPLAAPQTDDIGSDEEKLIDELEEEIMSSIRLHEKFLARGTPAFGASKAEEAPPKVDTISNGITSDKRQPPQSNEVIKFDAALQHGLPLKPQQTSESERPPQRNLLSLFDESSEDESSDENASISPPSLASSLAAEAGDIEERDSVHDYIGQQEAFDNECVSESLGRPELNTSSKSSSPERVNPLHQLDDDDEEGQEHLTVLTQFDPPKSVVTSNGPATTKLSCPLADVVSTNTATTTHSSSHGMDLNDSTGNELQVYHLTFYSRKIGLQFQKVPPPPIKAKGLLTEAMTTDLAGIPKGGEKTAAELRRISTFTSGGPSTDDRGHDYTCELATPTDAVLVCGFTGFDDSGSNMRPKLGARLVAFDGVSVEVGKWTFESIRKAIQARSRPLTLSFRDDFLTTEQRQILTRAAQEVQTALLPPQRAIQYRSAGNHRRGPSMDAPSVFSGLSGETDQMAGSVETRTTPHSGSQEDDRSRSISSDYRHAMPHSFSASRSVSSGNGAGVSFRSFSEAGSSVSMLSAVAPLVTNLLLKGGRKEPFTPEYLQREPTAVEDTPQHQDFKSELL